MRTHKSFKQAEFIHLSNLLERKLGQLITAECEKLDLDATATVCMTTMTVGSLFAEFVGMEAAGFESMAGDGLDHIEKILSGLKEQIVRCKTKYTNVINAAEAHQ